ERDRLVGRAGEVDGTAHRLADTVEPVLVGERPAGAETGDRGEDDVGLRLAQAVEVERQRAQHRGRQIGDHDIGGGDEFFDDLAAFRRGGVEGHPQLVAVHRQEHRAAALGPGADRDDRAVLAAAPPLDADHLRAEIAEQRGAEWAGDVAAEIEYPNAVENTRHACLPYADFVQSISLPESASKSGPQHHATWLCGTCERSTRYRRDSSARNAGSAEAKCRSINS